jgi:hypothetical protein
VWQATLTNIAGSTFSWYHYRVKTCSLGDNMPAPITGGLPCAWIPIFSGPMGRVLAIFQHRFRSKTFGMKTHSSLLLQESAYNSMTPNLSQFV